MTGLLLSPGDRQLLAKAGSYSHMHLRIVHCCICIGKHVFFQKVTAGGGIGCRWQAGNRHSLVVVFDVVLVANIFIVIDVLAMLQD